MNLFHATQDEEAMKKVQESDCLKVIAWKIFQLQDPPPPPPPPAKNKKKMEKIIKLF